MVLFTYTWLKRPRELKTALHYDDVELFVIVITSNRLKHAVFGFATLQHQVYQWRGLDLDDDRVLKVIGDQKSWRSCSSDVPLLILLSAATRLRCVYLLRNMTFSSS